MYLKVKAYLIDAYNQSIKNNFLFQIKENANALNTLFEKKGQIDSAYFYHKIFKPYNDSLLKNKNLMRMGLLIVQNKIEDERRIERMKQDRKELIYTIVIISIIG